MGAEKYSNNCFVVFFLSSPKTSFIAFIFMYVCMYVCMYVFIEREGEERQSVRKTFISCLTHAPNQGPGPDPMYVP